MTAGDYFDTATRRIDAIKVIEERVVADLQKLASDLRFRAGASIGIIVMVLTVSALLVRARLQDHDTPAGGAARPGVNRRRRATD